MSPCEETGGRQGTEEQGLLCLVELLNEVENKTSI